MSGFSKQRIDQLRADMALFFHERGFTQEEIREAERWAMVDHVRAARCYAALSADIRKRREPARGINERIRAAIDKEKRDAA